MSTPADLAAARTRLAAARSALGARSHAENARSLGAALESFREPGSPHRERLLGALPAAAGFSPETVRAGVDLALAEWDTNALAELVERELAGVDSATGFSMTSVLLAGSIPMPSLLAMTFPLVLGSPILVKTASRDLVTAPLFAGALREIDPALGACVEVTSFSGEDEACAGVFFDAPCVAATGSDATIRAVAERIRPGARLVADGHRLSLALLGPESTRPESVVGIAEQLAIDVALWDQLGCCSPIAVLAIVPEPAAAEPFARALAVALEGCEKRWPRGEIDTEAAAAIRSERDALAMRLAAGRDVSLHASDDTRWTVVREDDAEWRAAPLHRFVRVLPVAHVDNAIDALQPVAAHLAAVALAGFGAETGELAARLSAAGASRVCEPGRMQAPPLGWHHDGRALLQPLAQLSDLELP